DHFGGDETYIKNIQNDQLKEELCNGRGINLIRISHTEELTIELLEQKNKEIGSGSGHIKEGFHTNKEKKEDKQARLNQHAKEKRKQYQSTKAYKGMRESQREWRKSQYQKSKAWKANRKNKP